VTEPAAPTQPPADADNEAADNAADADNEAADKAADKAAYADSEAADTDGADATPAEVPVRRRRGWRIARRIAVWTLSVVLVLALVATGFVVWSVRRAFPDVDGTLALPGLSAPVTVYRDEHGIPQVYAQSAHDLFAAQGYMHAQDRFWEMDFRRHVTAGRVAELFGPDQVPTDAFLRTSGWRRVAEQEWGILADETKANLQAYADGVNAWIQANGGASSNAGKSLEYTVLGLTTSGYTVEPWTPIDSLAWLKAMAWDLRGNMEQEIDRAALLASGLTRDQIEQLYPEYPYDRHAPIVPTGGVVDGAFDATAPILPGTGAADVITAAVWRDAAPALAAVSAGVRAVPTLLGDNASGDIGSNSFVVGGALTATGKPLLANDPHLSPSMPGIWYQMGLHCTCEYNVEGFTFSGVPGVVIGHNAHIAWGFTNLNPDVSDLYLERVDGDRVLDGSTWVPLTTREETIKVAGAAPVTITVRSSRHGPLLSDRSADMASIAAAPPVDPSGSPEPRLSPHATPSLDPAAPGVPAAASSLGYAVALRWTALDPGHTADALFVLDTASNWKDFRRAASMFEVPAQNLVYADVDGNIGYQSPGKVPVRGKGDGRWPAPGWDRAYDWSGYLPFSELPNEFNPPGGVIVTANQAVTGPQYQDFLTKDWDYGYRSQRIMDLIAEYANRGKLTAEDIRQIQFDNRNGFAPVVVDALRAVPAGKLPPVAESLFTWDFQQPADSGPAALYNVFWRHLMARTFDELPADRRPNGNDRWWEVMRTLLADPNSPWWDDRGTPAVETRDDILVAAMNDAVAELNDRLGHDPASWHWGDLHKLGLINQTFGKSGIAPVEWLFNRGPEGVSGGSSIVNATGWEAGGDEADPYTVTAVPSMRMIVDLSNLDASRWVQLTGNSGHAFSANYDDQFDLWRTGQNLPMRWDRASVQAGAHHTLTLTP
jgi:penicillin amidase